jgi:lysophospholipase L1-like esterase
MRASDRGSGWAGKLALLGVGLAVSLLLGELLTRLLAPQSLTPAFITDPDDRIHQRDPELGLVLRPRIDEPFAQGTRLVTNSRGLRDRELGPKGPGEIRILSLGDSYAMGFGVGLDECYGKVLERELRLRGISATVVNAGVDGYATKQELLTYRRLRDSVAPDFILATFVAGNDVFDNSVFEDRLATNFSTPLGWVGRHSQLVQLVLRHTFPLWFFWDNREGGRIAHTIRLLRELEGELQAAGVPYLMLVIPARHQIRPEVEPATRLLVGVGLEGFILRQNRRVIEHFQEDGVPYLNLLPPLVAKDRETPVSFADDSHLNAVGHAVIAREVLRKLETPLTIARQARGKPERLAQDRKR